MSTLVECDNVSYVRDGNVILSDVSICLEQAQHCVILGPNGAGKTTLISLISGRAFPTAGRVKLLGEELGKVNTAELHQRIGLCSSAILRRIPPHHSLESTILYSAYGVIAGSYHEVFDESDRKRACDLMNAFGISHLSNHRIDTLSDGERQRMMICRALMADPEIMLLDEPAAGVDLGAREELMGALSELASDSHSPLMILVTHHVEEIPTGFSHALIMKNGSLVEQGKTDEVVTSHILSRIFSLPLKVEKHDGRYSAVGV